MFGNLYECYIIYYLYVGNKGTGKGHWQGPTMGRDLKIKVGLESPRNYNKNGGHFALDLLRLHLWVIKDP